MRRAHIELFARWLEETGRAKSTVARRLSTITGFYRYCTEEQLISHSPAAHVRRPRVSYESNQTPLDRNEVGMFLVQAGISGAGRRSHRHPVTQQYYSGTRASQDLLQPLGR